MLRVSEATIGHAGKVATASLYEAYLRKGSLPSRIKPLTPTMRVCGRALPVLSPVGDNLQLHHAVYVAEPGDVLVVDTCDTDEFGYWGEILAIAALQRGIAGLVISGGVRDAPALCRLDFPTFAANICIRGTSKNPDLGGSICDPVRLGDVTVNRGDLVVGDADGVVVISADEAKIVVDKALQREHEEEKIFRRLRAGETTLAIYGLPAVKGAK